MTAIAPMRQRAFTLLELLVVLAIFGLFAAMAYGGLNHVLTTRKTIEASLTRMGDWQRAFQKLRNDFQLVSTRPTRNGLGLANPAFVFSEFDSRVEFSHAGWRNPLFNPRASIERVALRYNQREHELVRESFGAMDVVREDQGRKLVLLTDITDASWRFMDNSHQYVSRWPATNADPPLAVELTLKSKDFNEVRWLFRIGVKPTPVINSGGSSSSSGSGSSGSSSSSSGSTGSSSSSGNPQGGGN